MFLTMMNKYFDLLLFYSFEFLGSAINLFCSFFGCYPSVDLGVKYLLYKEARRIQTEHHSRATDRSDKSGQADKLKERAFADE